jgi:hypothetical protein
MIENGVLNCLKDLFFMFLGKKWVKYGFSSSKNLKLD